MHWPGVKPTAGIKPKLAVILVLAAILTAVTTGASTANTSLVSISSAPVSLAWGPYMTGTSASGTVINVKTHDISLVTVFYAEEGYYKTQHTLNKSATDGLTGLLHHVTLNGLEAGTTYCYQVSCNGAITPVYTFSTFPTSGAISFIVYGDNQDELPQFSQAERHQLVAERIAAEEDVLFVLNTGDLVNDGSDNANWDRYFAAARSMSARLPVYPVRGNHDGDTKFYDIFGISPYYSFDCGDAHFTMLDTIGDHPGQTEWLKADLANHQPWKFVFCHYPIYTSEANHFGGWENFKSDWENIFIANQVAAVWSGHIHVYERYLENGIMYIVGGTGGGPYDILEPTRFAGHQNSLEHCLGYSKVTLNPVLGTAIVQFIQVADISIDGKQVTLLPPGVVFETFILTSPPAAGPALGPDEYGEGRPGSIWSRFKSWLRGILISVMGSSQAQ